MVFYTINKTSITSSQPINKLGQQNLTLITHFNMNFTSSKVHVQLWNSMKHDSWATLAESTNIESHYFQQQRSLARLGVHQNNHDGVRSSQKFRWKATCIFYLGFCHVKNIFWIVESFGSGLSRSKINIQFQHKLLSFNFTEAMKYIAKFRSRTELNLVWGPVINIKEEDWKDDRKQKYEEVIQQSLHHLLCALRWTILPIALISTINLIVSMRMVHMLDTFSLRSIVILLFGLCL